jgi:DNA polymerase III subunit delta'
MNQSLLLHPSTRRQIENYLTEPSQALLLMAPAGFGKGALSHYLAAQLIGAEIEKIVDQPGFIKLAKPAGNQEIPIDQVRRLVRKLSLKAGSANRVVLIEDAHFLSEEAQNALLKIIEEPPQRTFFILTSTSRAGLLPTIRSRVQQINLSPATQTMANDFFESSYTASDINNAWSLSRGAVGLLTALLRQSQDHPLKASVESVKNYLKMDKFQRLVFLDSVSADSSKFAEFLEAFNRVLSALSDASIARRNPGQSRKLLAARRMVNDSLVSLNNNASSRLVCLNLALSLPV